MRATPSEIQRRIEAVVVARRRFFRAEPDARAPQPVQRALREYEEAFARFKRNAIEPTAKVECRA